ncbi:hypothetical protein LshimejAT787_0407270 [Lyophyllum shimeji]|uniref:PH domain-containing protein n=1 Tax=Lyophyllum shimeji TaxID=47721 RepID=A0A9P3UNW1_LYOSH|nr:hypothetical protein LshimejAT787_0407270 [Lyophyllum shimeji]
MSQSPERRSRPSCGAYAAPKAPPKVSDNAKPFDVTKKERSPIRQSFRNLLSVFKKANIRKAKQDEEPPLSSFRRQHQPFMDDLPAAPPVLRSRSRKLTSSLLYLSRPPQLPSSSPILPVWTSCTATLESDSIVISSFTAQGNPSVHSIQLSNCADVRSLSTQQLDPAESALLPRRRENQELKVFEILFEGRPREKFAANSVQERAAWVSAVWDTVLPDHDPPTSAGSKPQLAKMASDPSTSLSGSKNPAPLGQPSMAPTSSIPSQPERSLPSLPADTKPALSLDMHILNAHSRTASCSPASASVYTPTRPVSRASSAGDPRESRAPSPSIMNLSQLSVVRQRLAQIQPTTSQSSHGSLTSPTSSRASSCSRLTTPVFGSRKGPLTSPTESQDMLRVHSARSSAADSILNSYTDCSSHQSIEATELSLIRSAPEEVASQQPPLSPGRASHQPSMTYPGLQPVVELLHDQSAKHADQAADLGNQVLSLRNDVQRMPFEIASAISMAAHSEKVMKMVARVEAQARANGEAIGCIQNSLQEESLKHRGGALSGFDNLTQELQSFRDQLSQDLSHICSKLDSVHPAHAEGPVQLNNVAASKGEAPVPSRVVDLSEPHKKLDDLLAASTDGPLTEDEQNSSSANATKTEEMLKKVIGLLEKDSGQQALQAQQQAESVRYLNELNSWLEVFVNNGTSQISNISAGVDQLCRDLGSVEGGSSVLADIRQLALATAARDQSSAALQASVDGLLAMLQEQAAASNIASIASLVDRQRQDHEGLLRALATEISVEIKGERLRFVEAMKEATAINVQIHVEQFKKELQREVMEMTKEVGRLHRDRQAMQNQIADLFAFYIKHKAANQTAHNDVNAVVQERLHTTTSVHEKQSGTRARRPLPRPHG